MKATKPLPAAARPFAGFGPFLREFEFAVAPEQVTSFMSAVTLLGPRHMEDIRHAAHATLAPPPDRHDEFDALFAAYFTGKSETARQHGEDVGETVVKDDSSSAGPPPDITKKSEAGHTATAEEILSQRTFRDLSDDEQLIRLRRKLPAWLPRRQSRRLRSSTHGRAIDIRRTMRSLVRNDGDIPALRHMQRQSRQRNLLVLIDVSGSMKEHTAEYMKLVHAMARTAGKLECFTFGTRLTRISRAIRHRDQTRALQEAANVVEDWDGGTRIGDALKAFLAIPRFAAFARSAVTIVISDGLERGGHTAMVEAVAKLSRRSWRLAWLTPLAADTRFEPKTEALRAILPWIDDLASAGTITDIAQYVSSLKDTDRPWHAGRWLHLAEGAP